MKKMSYLSWPLLLYICIALKLAKMSRSSEGQDQIPWRSRSNKKKLIFEYCKCFCAFCVMQMVHHWLAFLYLFKFTYNAPFFEISTCRPEILLKLRKLQYASDKIPYLRNGISQSADDKQLLPSRVTWGMTFAVLMCDSDIYHSLQY